MFIETVKSFGSLLSSSNYLCCYVIIRRANNIELKELLKELDKNLNINRVERSERILYLYCNIKCTVANCKYCGMESRSIHSRYIRIIFDFPIQDYQVKLVITVPKFFYINKTCFYRTFAYPILFATANLLRTKQLDDYIYQVEMKSSSLEAEKQISDSYVFISNNTILRVIYKKWIQLSIMK